MGDAYTGRVRSSRSPILFQAVGRKEQKESRSSFGRPNVGPNAFQVKHRHRLNEKRKLRIPVKTYAGTVLPMLFLFAGTVILAVIVILASYFTSGAGLHKLTAKWARFILKVLGISYSLHGAAKITPGTSYIVTPNHQSFMDFLALASALPLRFRWVLKKDLTSLPLFGWGLVRIGAVSIDRSRGRNAVKIILAAAEKLKDGWSLLIYPEGTTTRDGFLLPFKKGPFKLAVKTGVPVLPVTCNGPFKILPRGSRHIKSGHIEVTIGDPIITKELTEKDIPELLEKTRSEIAKYLDPDYNPFEKDSRQSHGDAAA